MNKGLTLVTGLGLGAGIAYLLDPEMGNRRRARARDRATHLVNKTGGAIEAAARDLQHRTVGLASEWTSRLAREEVTDQILTARIRSKLGLVVSHPSSITVEVDRGRVTLQGPILTHEANRLLSAIRRVRGVVDLEDALELHSEADGVPGLQGGAERAGERFELMQENWSPAARLLAGAAGLGLTFYGAGRKGIAATAVGTIGLGLLTRGLTNLPMNRLVGIGAGHRAVDIQKTITIAAPVEQVFEFWNNDENFPRFMTNVREVKQLEEGRSRWLVAGPMGISMKWEAVITEKRSNEVLAWKSVPGSIVHHAGAVHFRPNSQGGTEVDIKMSYRPFAGALGHVVALLFGSDPKSRMDEDLMRTKALIETRIPPPEAG
jgi:uncharacterized membrane protein/osmotically-inducible protein OsmY